MSEKHYIKLIMLAACLVRSMMLNDVMSFK